MAGTATELLWIRGNYGTIAVQMGAPENLAILRSHEDNGLIVALVVAAAALSLAACGAESSRPRGSPTHRCSRSRS